MSEEIQLLSFFFSFLYGILFHLCVDIHYKISIKYSLYLKLFTTILLVINFILFYVLFLYHLNNGIIHLYFIIFLILGFIFFEFVKKNVNFPKIIFNKIAKLLKK